MRVTRKYPLEFKIDAVRLYLNNNRKLEETARELGVPSSTLIGWKDKYMNEAKGIKKDKISKKAYEEVLKEKEKRIKELEEENLILKKSIGIFTKSPGQK